MNGCEQFNGRVGADGYSRLPDGRLEHRVVYEKRFGPIPAGLVIDHLCRNRGCINPSHMEPVTRGENSRRGINPRGQQTHCKNGHALDEVNTRFLPNGNRVCKTCVRAAAAKHRSNNRDKLRERARTNYWRRKK